jgi:Dyp-type peroxidase family
MTTVVGEKASAVHELELDQIQGNILSGFNKDHQMFLFLHFKEGQRGRDWLASVQNEIASTGEVEGFNRLFKHLERKRDGELGALKATWANVAFTLAGLKKLAAEGSNLQGFPKSFTEGMRSRAKLLGDVGASTPETWVFNREGQEIHAVLLVAADSQPDLHQHVMRYLSGIFLNGGITLVFLQEGAVRADQPGHEHFGFKDGVSQPGIRGFTPNNNPKDSEQGNPGQDLLWPGEFVIGYETQFGKADPKEPTELNTAPGPVSTSGPDWTRNGSYLVFRRLRQDVAAFRNQLKDLERQHQRSIDVIGAKLVGRYASGCPLELTKDESADPKTFPPPFDPTAEDPSGRHSELLDDLHNNNFEYGGDPQGQFVPRAGHIRKAYPRDETSPRKSPCDNLEVNENTTQRHRLLRRGIPFGTSFRPTLGAISHPITKEREGTDRGLLFLAYQSDIERQFEFVQACWVNDKDFPQNGDGQDPIIAQSPNGDMKIPGVPKEPASIKHFVTTTGGEYFFQPSLRVVKKLARGQKL